MNISHSFDVEIACRFGMEEAAIYNHLLNWLRHNAVKKVNQIEGRTWVYQSAQEIADLMPYIQLRKVKTSLKSLVDAGVFIAGSFNKDPFDRTLWYAFHDEQQLLASIGEGAFSKKSFDSTKTTPSRTQKRHHRAYQNDTMLIIEDTEEEDIETNTPPYPPQAGEPPAGGGSPSCVRSLPPSCEHLASGGKKRAVKSDFSEPVRQLAAKMVEVLQRHSQAYRPSADSSKLLETARGLLEVDKQEADYILKLLDYAAGDKTQRGDFNGWSTMIYSKGKQDGLQKFRSKIASIEASMQAKPVRKFAPSSDDDKSLEKWMEWKKDAL